MEDNNTPAPQMQLTAQKAQLHLDGARELLSAGMAGVVQVRFTCSEDWDGLSRIAVFSNGMVDLAKYVDFDPKEVGVKEKVRLIILQYGGNTMPYMKTDKSISQYRVSIEKQINHIRSQAPDAKILFIGPSDMSTNIQGKMQTYPHLPTMVDSLRTAANNAGAAYWDMYAAMGGSGSMAKWVKEVPALAGSDYIHFTPLGAEKMGGMLYESLMLYYEYYKLRKK